LGFACLLFGAIEKKGVSTDLIPGLSQIFIGELGYIKEYGKGLVNFLKVIYTLSIKNILKRRNQNFQILDSIHS